MDKESLNKYLEEVSAGISQANFSAAAQRKRYKQGYSFSGFPTTEQLIIWDFVWTHSDSFWVKIQSFFFCEQLFKKSEELKSIWPTIVNWQDQVNSWGLSDCLSKIYSKILEIAPEIVYPILVSWNTDSNLWKRRQSLVSLIYYNSVRNSVLPFDKLAPLIQNLLNDQEYYVQKGLGWTLRELAVRYPVDTINFLTKNVSLISPTAFSTAISKLKSEEKTKLKVLRKEKKATNRR